MKLDRNINDNLRGKYALLKLRKLDDFVDVADPFKTLDPKIAGALETLEKAGVLDWGAAGTEAEFMVIRLKDKYARKALAEYAQAAADDGEVEYATEIMDMALRSGAFSPWCQKPD